MGWGLSSNEAVIGILAQSQSHAWPPAARTPTGFDKEESGLTHLELMKVSSTVQGNRKRGGLRPAAVRTMTWGLPHSSAVDLLCKCAQTLRGGRDPSFPPSHSPETFLPLLNLDFSQGNATGELWPKAEKSAGFALRTEAAGTRA